ncbi:MAG: malonyl-ACP O-methyltransferase BioC [Kiritimatiellia bacterium]
MNRALLINRFARAVTTYESQATIQRHAAEYLAQLMSLHFHTLAPRILEIGCGTGLLTRQLFTRFAPAELFLNDLCPDMQICFANVPRTTFLPGDAMTLSLPKNVNAIASASAIQWFNDLEGFVARCANALAPKGLLAISSFGPANLREIVQLTHRGLSYPSWEEFCSILSQKFSPLSAEHETLTLNFPDATAVLRHLKETGVTATNESTTPWTRATLSAFTHAYEKTFPAPHAGVMLTYEPFYFVGRLR